MTKEAKAVLRFAVIVLVCLALVVLAAPWFTAGFSKYTDWVYCQTHEPFVQHSWNTNRHHCPVAPERSI